MLFLLKKRSKSFILSIYALIEFTLFEKMIFFFVLILKWHVYMVFLKWCSNMVILYDFLGTWQQGHFEVYKQHVDMVILLAFFRLNDNSGFLRCFFFQIILSQIFIKTLRKLSSYKEVLMKYFTVLNYITRWQNDSTLWMFCNMVISISFLLLFPLWQKRRISIVNFDSLKHEKKAILRNEWSKKFLVLKGSSYIHSWFSKSLKMKKWDQYLVSRSHYIQKNLNDNWVVWKYPIR